MWSVRSVTSTGSTNADVAAAARDGAAEGLVVAAGHQSAGRGRLDRRWEAPPGAALAISFLLRPDGVPMSRWPWLPLLVGVAVVEAVNVDLAADAAAGSTGVGAVLKWPNDVLVSGRKLAGILVERVDTPQGPAAVAGVGLNLTQSEDGLPPGATSLRLAGAADVDRHDVVERLCGRLQERYTAWRAAAGDPAGGPAEAYAEHCDTLGRDVRAELPGGDDVVGRAVRIDEAGRLVVDTGEGLTAVGAGDIVHLRPAGEVQH